MGKYVLKIGTSEFNKEIQGTEDWRETIERDFTEKLLRVKGDYRFTGWQGLYDMLYTNLATNGVCQSLEGRVYFRGDKLTAFSEVWRGEIKMQDGEHDLINYSVNSQILDNCWSAKFNNSKDQKVFIRTDLSKNDISISPCPYIDAGFYNPTDGAFYGDTRRCFRVHEVLGYLVSYYSDGEVTFQSDYYTTGDGRQYSITTGRELRLFDGGVNPEVSFTEVFTELNKKHNLWIIIEGTLDAPILRIEPASYSLDPLTVIDIDNPEGITMKTDLDQLYTTISVGSDAVNYDVSDDASYLNVFFDSWNDESYNSTGDCQFENTQLDLLSTWKIDSNSIEQSLKGSEDHDSDIFLIEIDDSNNAYEYTDNFTEGNADITSFYNFNLTNSQVIDNWFEALPTVVAKQLSQNYYTYVDTYSGTPAGTFDVLEYSNDTTYPASDFFGIYDTTNFVFTAPVNGDYRFQGVVNVSNIVNTAHIFRHRIRVWDGSSVPPVGLGTAYYGPIFTGGSAYALPIDVTIYLEAGWIVRAEAFQNIAGNFDVDAAYMEMTGPPRSIVDGTNDPLIYLYDIPRFALSEADYETIKANKTQRVKFRDTKTGRQWMVWPKEMTYDRERQIASGEFIGYNPLNAVDLCWVLDGSNGLGFWSDECYWRDDKSWID